MGEWKIMKLGEIVTFQRGHDLPQTQFVEGPFIVAGSNGPIGYHHKFTARGPGLTLGRSGNSIGVAHYYDNDFWAHNTVLFSREFHNAFPKYVYYLLRSLDFRSFDGGSAVPTLNRNHIHPIAVNLPSFPEQQAIAEVLSSLDDKIDLLHRQNKTLEGIAQALWRKMFIEDAKPIWEKGTLGDIADNIRVNVCVAELNNYQHYVGLEHMEKKHFALYDWGNTSELESNKSCFRNRDILFGKLRAYFHKVCFAPVDGVCSTDILVIRPKMPEFHTLCLLWFFSEDVVNYSDVSSGGTRMPRTNWDTLASYEILIPPGESVAEFDHHVLPVIDRIEHNIFSIRTLARLRDTLLPKLMSGEVRVKL